MAPVAASIEGAVAKLSDNSQTGVASLVERFTQSVQGAAGAELKELATALGQMQISLAETQRSLQGTGEDFGNRLSAAAEGLERLLASAGERVKDSQEQAAQQIASTATQAAEGLRLGLSDFVERFSNEVKSVAGAGMDRVPLPWRTRWSTEGQGERGL
jgi:DNA repair ATPase RecN